MGWARPALKFQRVIPNQSLISFESYQLYKLLTTAPP